MNGMILTFCHFAELQTSWKVDMHRVHILHPSCVPEKVGIITNDIPIRG